MNMRSRKGVESTSGIEVDKVLHEPKRLFIVNFIVEMGGKADFNTLLKATGLSKGNLWSHLRVLEKVGYIEVKKKFLGRKPHTEYYITEKGREALEVYVTNMIKKLKRAAEAVERLKKITEELRGLTSGLEMG